MTTAEQLAQLRGLAVRAASDDWGYDRDEFYDALTPEMTLALLDELEQKDKRIAELEARKVTVKLPQPIRATALGRDFSALQYSETVKLLRDAGINLTVEG